jgi:tight adherence protein B
VSALLPLAITLVLLVAGGAAWFAALLVTRRARIDLDRRVNLVGDAPQAPLPGEVVAVAPRANPLAALGTSVRRLFTLGASRRWGMRAGGLLLIAIAIAAGVCAWLLTHTALRFSYWIAIPATVAGFVLAPRWLLQRQQRRTEQQFMMLFPDAIDMIIRMLRAGLPITAATRNVGDEAPAPVNLVFRAIADQVDIGVPFEASIAAAGESIGLPDFRFFAVAIALQRETGGNLAATLEILADIIRKRRNVRLRAQAATGEIRMSAYILGTLPFLVTGAFLVISPGYLTPLAVDPRGHVIVGAALLGLTLAYLTMRRMLHSVTMA